MIETLRKTMAEYRGRDLSVDLPEAAVLMPFTDRRDPEVILTVRAAAMPTHAGEVAFPGGKRDPQDADLLATALRESEEEVRLPRNRVEVLGALSPIPSRYGMKVTPFVGVVDPVIQLQAEPGEIKTIFRVPLSFFLDTRPELSSPIDFYGRKLCIPSYFYDNKRIWGLTAFMILELLNHSFDAGIEFEVASDDRGKTA